MPRPSPVTAFFLPAHDHYLSDKGKNISSHLFLDDSFCPSTERQADILEAFRHPKVAIGAERCNEICFFFVFFAELCLVVPRETVQQSHHFTACC
jgi:hypothetical protein